MTGHCGEGIMWRTTMVNIVIPLSHCKHDRICGIKVTVPGGWPLYIVSVYLPQPNSNLVSFEDVIIDLELWVEQLQAGGIVLIAGDWNAHFGQECSKRCWGKNTKSGTLTLDMFSRLSTKCIHIDESICTGPDYTFCNSWGVEIICGSLQGIQCFR